MRLNRALILMTAFAVISDALLIPFYPQFFAERYGLHSPWHVGAYVAAISVVVMCVFPLWVRLARRVETLHILQYTQGIAALLCLASYFAPSAPAYWLLSMLMFAFKSSYLLTFPYLMRLESDDTRAGTIGLLSVTAHVGVIVGAVGGGLAIDHVGVGACVLLMAAADLLQMTLCTWLIRSRRMVPVLDHDAPERAAPRRLAFFSRHAPLLRLALVMLLFDFSAAITRPFFSLYWTETTGLGGETLAGLVFAIPKAVAAIALFVNRYLLTDERHLLRNTLANLLLGAFGLCLQAIPDVAALLLGRALFGWALYQLVVNFDMTLFAMSTPDDFGRDFGVINFFQNTGVLIASFTAGSLVALHGLHAPFAVACAGFLVAAVVWRRHFAAPTASPETPAHAKEAT